MANCPPGPEGDAALCCQPSCPHPDDCIRIGQLQSTPDCDLAPFCAYQKQKKEFEQKMKSRCRQLGEYDPCQNPCCRIPGQHPFCPPGQVVGILPKSYVQNIPRSLNKPTAGPPPRIPWMQCVENVVVNDQVRRPMARWCHLRPLPPVVIPNCEIERMRESIGSNERAKAECEAARAEKERLRQESYQRHSEWNYTVDSLLARKRAEAEGKARAEEKEFQDLSKSIKEGRDQYSAEMMGRAKEQLLYRKGLIRNLHAAMALSKSIKEQEDIRRNSAETSRKVCQFPDNCLVFPSEEKNKRECPPCIQKGCQDRKEDPKEGEEEKCPLPIFNTNCMKRLLLENSRPEYLDNTREPEKCSEERLRLLKTDENRCVERKCELEKEKALIKHLRTEQPIEWPQSYINYIKEPECEDPKGKIKRQEKLRDDLFMEIHDKLAADAFIEYHEKEVDRQACEYREYKRRIDRMRKEKEAQLIKDKVQCNIKSQELAAKMWEEVKKKKFGTDQYARLKEQWEEEHAKKEAMQKTWRNSLLDQVERDYLCRKDNALVKRTYMDATREWEKECCVAKETYEMECAKEETRRQKAKELQQYHLDQIANRVDREEEERFMNAVWGEKARVNYACEMQEMKDYAMRQMQEWKAKGRPLFPLIHAIKKWDYDMGMTPELYARTPLCGEPRPPPQPDPNKETTAKRLGFDC